MPLLDVSDLLGDPDFADDFILRRTSVTVGEDGLSIPITADFALSGVVQAGGGDNRQVSPDAALVTGTLMVHATVPLRAETASSAADIVIWPAVGGREFTVSQVQDYSRFGTGYWCAQCVPKAVVAS